MKIVYLIAYPGFAGSEKYSFYLAGEAKKNGHQVNFIVGEQGPLTKELEKSHIPYQVVPMGSSFNPIKLWRSAFGLRKALKDLGAEIVHTNMLREHSIAILAKLLGARISVVRTFHRLDNFNWKMEPLMWLYNIQTNAYIAPTEFMKKIMVERGVSEEKIYVIANGCPEIKVDSHKVGVGFLGRIVEEKGILNLVKSWKLDLPLLIAGEGPQLEKVKQLAKGKNVKVIGQIIGLKEFFADVSVLALPSKNEVMPLSIIESFSAGVPVVAFNIEPLRGLINTKTGILVDQGDYVGFQEAIERVLDNKINPRDIYLANYTVLRMWKETSCLYKSL